MARPRKPFAGVLVQPMPWPLESVMPIHERRIALFAHYDIDPETPGADGSLALALAMDFVPGFSVAKKGGRPATNVTKDAEIVLELHRAKIAGRSVNEAAQHLANRWNRRGRKVTATALRQRYYTLLRSGPERERLQQLVQRASEDD